MDVNATYAHHAYSCHSPLQTKTTQNTNPLNIHLPFFGLCAIFKRANVYFILTSYLHTSRFHLITHEGKLKKGRNSSMLASSFIIEHPKNDCFPIFFLTLFWGPYAPTFREKSVRLCLAERHEH